MGTYRKYTEATILAELYHHLRTLGLEADLEFTTPVGRLDMIVMNPKKHGEYCLIIEGKKNEISLSEKQLNRYKSLGLPVWSICNFHNVSLAAKDIHDFCHTDPESHTREFLMEDHKGLIKKCRNQTQNTVKIGRKRIRIDEDLNYRH